jgi:hypothetical protein
MGKRRTVGYKNPPVATRFRPGQSGNPRGRPKGSRNLATEIRKALNKRILVTDKGRQRKVSKQEALATQLINKAIQDPKLFAMVLRAAGPVDEEDEAGGPETTFQPEDELVMGSIVRRIRQMEYPPSFPPSGVPAQRAAPTEEGR